MKKKVENYSPPLKVWTLLKEVNDSYNAAINEATKSGKPVIIATGMAPQQIFNTFDDVVYVCGEWYGSICGYHKDSHLAETAERCGFLHELCSYARMTLGSAIEDKGFLGKFPKPAGVMGMEGFCIVQTKWFEALARYYNAPFFVMDSAPIMAHDYKNWGEEAVKDSAEFVKKECYKALEFLEWVTGQKVDEEKFIDVTKTMHENELLWDELLELCGKKPSPVTLRNLFTFENLIVSLPHKKDATRVLKAAIEEINERIEKGITGIENEEIRLLWNAQPGWYVLDTIKYFHSHGAAFVGSPYLAMMGSRYRYDCAGDAAPEWLTTWEDPTNMDECLWQIAKGVITQGSARPRLDATTDEIKRIAIRTQADGAVWHAVRGCKGESYGQLGEMDAIRNDLGLPVFLLEGSPADPRDFSQGPALRQIRIFIEQVKRMKKRRLAKEKKKK